MSTADRGDTGGLWGFYEDTEIDTLSLIYGEETILEVANREGLRGRFIDIVQACNAFPALVEALRKMVNGTTPELAIRFGFAEQRDMAVAALAQAGVSTNE